MSKIYGSTEKYCFIDANVRILLELSISRLHRSVNILKMDYLKKNINLFVFPIFCDPHA